TSYGSNCASDLASVLVDVGVAVVSGGARGIDAAAHRGCMSSGGRTVAVTGTGADISYPASHSALFREIREEGCLLTEFPLGTPPRPWNFPRRNRLIAGLCSRCVVVEAPEKSGAVLTARLALEAGREVWAVPGRITDGVCKGSNALISDGAMPLVDIRVFAALVSGRQGALFPTGGRREDTAGPVLTPEEAEVLRILADHGEMTVDNISAEGKMSAAVVLRGLGVLSAYGLVAPGGPGRWSKRTQGRG
ncbi:MAG: DNA-processing protein DprA, partial [Thermovirgaceae bacterium]